MDLQSNVNELITMRTNGVEDAMKSMKDIESLFDKVTSNYRPLLNGERYLSDVEVSHRLKVSRRTLQDYRDNGTLPYFKLGGKVLYRESDLEALLLVAIILLSVRQCNVAVDGDEIVLQKEKTEERRMLWLLSGFRLSSVCRG